MCMFHCDSHLSPNPSSLLCRDGIHKRRYESAAAVVADILQMYDNCELYNDESSVLSKEARRQRKEFQKFCKKNALL